MLIFVCRVEKILREYKRIERKRCYVDNVIKHLFAYLHESRVKLKRRSYEI
jgi:hypothetical protein